MSQRHHLNGWDMVLSQEPQVSMVPYGPEPTVMLYGIPWHINIIRPLPRVGPGKCTWYTHHRPIRKPSKYQPHQDKAERLRRKPNF